MIPLVVVLGPYRGGTSCVAGIVHHLGAYMGKRFAPAKSHNPMGFYEPEWLSEQIRMMWDEHALWRGQPRSIWLDSERVPIFAEWIHSAYIDAEKQGKSLLGVKHPLLCFSIMDLVEATPGPIKWICVNRDFNTIVKSLGMVKWVKRGFCSGVTQALLTARDNAFSTQSLYFGERLNIRYEKLIDNPYRVVKLIAEFVGVDADDRILEAVDSVIPSLDHGLPR